jgi:uncharacterized protein (DUF433 family)
MVARCFENPSPAVGQDHRRISTLLDYIEAGQPLSEFLEDFPTVSKEQAVAALEQAKEALLARARPA